MAQGLKKEERIIFAVKAFPSQQRVGKQMALPKQMGFVSLSTGESCQEAAGWERPCKHWFNPSVLPLPAGMLYQHLYLLHHKMLQGHRKQSGELLLSQAVPVSPSLAPPGLPAQWLRFLGAFHPLAGLALPLLQAQGICASKSKQEATPRASQRCTERQ